MDQPHITMPAEEGLRKLKKSASMTSLRNAFGRKLEAVEMIPPVPAIPTQYATDHLASVERFPDFHGDSTASPESGSTSTTRYLINREGQARKKASFKLRVKKSFRSLTFSSRTRPSFGSLVPPHTAPLQQGQYTIDRRRRSSSPSFESYGPVVSRNEVPRTFGSFGSSNSVRSGDSDLSLLRQLSTSFKARREVFDGIGREPRPDTRKPLYSARIKDGPGGSKIARSGAPAMPNPEVADFDPEYWDGALGYVKGRVREEEALAAHENEEANRRHSSPEELEAKKQARLKRRIYIGTNWVKRTSEFTFAIDWKAWPDIMSEEDSSMAYEALCYWLKYGGSEADVKGLVSGILYRIQEKISPSTPFPDLPKPRQEGKRMPDASIPPVWKEYDEKYAKRNRQIDEILSPGSASSHTTSGSPQPDPVTPKEQTQKEIRKGSTNDLRGSTKRNASSITLKPLRSRRLSPPASLSPTSALPPVPPIPPMSVLQGLEPHSGSGSPSSSQLQRQPRLRGQEPMRALRTGTTRGVLPLTGSPNITPPSGSSDLIINRARSPLAYPARLSPLLPRQKTNASTQRVVPDQKTGSDEEKDRQRSVALSVLESSLAPLNPDTLSTVYTLATAGSPPTTGLGILNAGAERQAGLIDPNAVIPADFHISGLNINLRQRGCEQLSDKRSDDSIAHKTAERVQPKRSPGSGLSRYERAFSPQVGYELPEGATDPYGDDYEMDVTPSKPARSVHRRAVCENRGLMDFTWTMEKAHEEAESMIHPAFRSPASQESVIPPRPSRAGVEMIPLERHIDQAISAWERGVVGYRDAEAQADPQDGGFF